MRVEKFNSNKNAKLSILITENYPTISYNQFQKLLRKKDIKVNGKRTSKDLFVSINDEISFFIIDDYDKSLYEDVYEDDNVLIVFKKRGIEVVSDIENSLLSVIKKIRNYDLFAVHRLDRNTEGLVIFAKNEESKIELDYGFKNRTFEKYYLALVYGELEKNSDNLIAYLKKDKNKSIVEISDKYKIGFDKIQTNYKLLKQYEDSALLEVELITGKTHQIRAHLAHIGHFIIGDEKYGKSEINKKFGKKYQNLIAFRLILHFSKGSKLYYLNKKTFEIEKNKIDFLNNY